MREQINLNALRQLSRQKISLLRYLFGISVDVLEHGGNNRSYIHNVILPILGLSTVTLSLTFFPLLITAMSVGVFALVTGITSFYSAYKNKQTMEKGQQNLAFEIAELEAVLQKLWKDFLSLKQQKQLNLISDEFYRSQKLTLIEALAILSDSLKGKGTRSEILKNVFGTLLDETNADVFNELEEELNPYEIRGEDEEKSLKGLFAHKMERVSVPEKMPFGIQTLIYGGAFAGGLALGFGVAMAILTVVAVTTFPWILIPIAAGLAIGGLALLRQHFVKRKGEQDQAQLQKARGQVRGLKSFVQHVHKKFEMESSHNKEIRMYQESAQEEQARIAVFASKQLEEAQKLQGEAKQLQKNATEELKAVKILNQGVMICEADLRARENVLKAKQEEVGKKEIRLVKSEERLTESQNKIENERTKLQEWKVQLIEEKNQLEEKLHLFEVEKIKFQKEYTQRDEIWKEREARIAAREKVFTEKEYESETDNHTDKLVENYDKVGLFNKNKHLHKVEGQNSERSQEHVKSATSKIGHEV